MSAFSLISRRQACATAIGVAGAALGLAGPAHAQRRKEPDLPAVGSALPLVDVPLLDGQVFRVAQAQDSVLLVYWWASWCPFCTVQNPHVESLWRAQRGKGLQVLALSIDRRREDAAAYLRRKGYTFPVGMLTPQIARVLPKPRGLPVTLVRGKDGKVLFAEGGEMFPEDIEGLARFL